MLQICDLYAMMHIKQRRLELKLTVDELAEKIGKSRATIYRYENGDIENMPTTILEPLAKALDTTPADLMGWTQYDQYFSGKDASDEIYLKLAQNCDRHHGKQQELTKLYGQLSVPNQSKVITYAKSLLSTQQMEEELLAAHNRTDLNCTTEDVQHDLDIMKDTNNWN